MSAYTSYFEDTNGNRLTLSIGGLYQLDPGFTPPGINYSYNLAAGNSLNRTGGATLVSKTFNDRGMEFRVKINATTKAQAQGLARGLASFLEIAKTFVYKPDAFPEPLWGQLGASMRYEIVTASASVGDLYAQQIGRLPVFWLNVTMEVKPNAKGIKQQLASAMGGIYEDTLGSTDGVSLGLRIPEATTNKMTNPVFSHSTWNTGWTFQANLLVTQNTDPNFTFPGATSSAKITSVAGSSNTAYQSINVGNTNKHAIMVVAKKQDSSAITIADCKIFYNASINPIFVSMGNGWYKIYANNVDGINAATATGLTVFAGVSLYLAAIQMEEKVYHTPICHGDMLGCAWTGTTGASTTTRAAGSVKIDGSNFSNGQGCAVIEWVPYQDSTSFNNVSPRIFETTGAKMRLIWDVSNTQWNLSDGTNSATSSATSFSANVPLIFHVNWGVGILTVHVNGVKVVNGNTYTPAAVPAGIYIGEKADVTFHSGGTYKRFALFDRNLTDAQITEMYADMSAATTRMDTIPWLWTKDGDNVFGNSDDTNRNNWNIIGGLPGNCASDYVHYINNSSTTKTAIWLGGFDIPANLFLKPTSNFYFDQSGTADANSSGGQYNTVVSPTILIGGTFVTPYHYQKYSFFIRMAKSATSANLAITPMIQLGNNTVFSGSPKTIALTTAMTLYNIGDVIVPNPFPQGFNPLSPTTLALGFIPSWNTGGYNVAVDYFQVIPGDLVRLGGTVLNASDYIGYDGKNVLSVDSGGNSSPFTLTGGELKLLPNRNNMIWGIIGAHGSASVITDTLTFTTFVTPRWSLL